MLNVEVRITKDNQRDSGGWAGRGMGPTGMERKHEVAITILGCRASGVQ